MRDAVSGLYNEDSHTVSLVFLDKIMRRNKDRTGHTQTVGRLSAEDGSLLSGE
jgi:hypothetical protein